MSILQKFYAFKFQVWRVHEELSAIGPMFSIAAAFGNVHGVYQAGNVTLQPERYILLFFTRAYMSRYFDEYNINL